jgi:hypothetical protein
MTIDQANDDGAYLRATLAQCTEGIGDEIGVRLRARSYPVRNRRRPVVAGAAVLVVVALVATLATSTGAKHAKAGAWELVSYLGTSSWQAAEGKGLQGGDNLICPTVSTCYAIDLSSSASGPVEIEATHDGGRTWQQTTLPRHTTFTVETEGSDALACFGNENCSTMGHNHGGLEFLTTDNGGHTWKSYREPRPLYWNQPIVAYACSTATTCVAVSSAGKDFPPSGTPADRDNRYSNKDYPAVAFTTTDGWRTWTRHDLPANFGPESIACSADDTCVAVGQTDHLVDNSLRSEVFVSTDAGAAWTAGRLPAQTAHGELGEPACVNGRDCLAVATVGAGLQRSTRVSVTADGGRTWTNVAGRGLLPSVQTLACATRSYCWVAGSETRMPSPGRIVTQFGLSDTEDRGRVWTSYSFPRSSHVLGVFSLACPSSTTCYAIADQTGRSHKAVLLRFTT